MTNNKLAYEYGYADAKAGHHHNYLVIPLQKLISKIKQDLDKPCRVLDIGCGNGSLSNLIATMGYEVVGVEDSVSGSTFASQNFPNCQFINASVYDLPYDALGGSFDIVISTEVIEHLQYPRELVRSAKKCLKPNGRLIITTPYHGYVKNLVLALTNKMDQHYTALWDSGHIKFFSVNTLSALLTDEGFTVRDWEFAGRLPLLWKSMLVSATLNN